jgi:hypothetical protein
MITMTWYDSWLPWHGMIHDYHDMVWFMISFNFFSSSLITWSLFLLLLTKHVSYFILEHDVTKNIHLQECKSKVHFCYFQGFVFKIYSHTLSIQSYPLIPWKCKVFKLGCNKTLRLFDNNYFLFMRNSGYDKRVLLAPISSSLLT